jgi:uncharacterized protein YndB with AHSA1/START domain
MTVTSVTRDHDALTMTVTAEFTATPERVWELWADPRQLERWWGPPGYPATFTSLDLQAGGRASYYMTGPEGVVTPLGYWEIVTAEPPRRLEMMDGFANADGTPNDEMPGPGGMNVTIEPIGDGRTRMTIENSFPDQATMEQLLAMGQEEGMTEAVGQIDAILAESTTGAAA